MNCNVEIIEPFKYGTSQGIAELKKGEIYPGTVSDGELAFHVTLPNNRIMPVLLESNDRRIKILTYANTAKV